MGRGRRHTKTQARRKQYNRQKDRKTGSLKQNTHMTLGAQKEEWEREVGRKGAEIKLKEHKICTQILAT